MSQETSTWLNTRTLIGFTDQRGHAWHYRADDQGDEPNHYPGAVPVDDVHRRLFGWDAVTASVFAEYYNPDGFVRLSEQGRKAVVRPAGAFGPEDAGAILHDVRVTGHALDHPIGFAEGAYLKTVLARVRRRRRGRGRPRRRSPSRGRARRAAP